MQNNETHIIEENQKKWVRCQNLFARNLSKEKFQTWFTPIEFVSYTAETKELLIRVPSNFVYEELEEKYARLMYTIIGHVFGAGTHLLYRVEADKTNDITVDLEGKNHIPLQAPQSSKKAANEAPNALQSVGQQPQDLDSHLNTDLNFDNFIEGPSNKLPRSVGQSIAENPKQMTFNPLFIYGPSGCGKTHLVNAIGTRVKELYPEKRVLYISAHLFQVQYTDSVRRNCVNDFINFYQSIDVLILDDVQEFAAVQKTQNTFFHIFNHLHQNKRQIIMTSDRPPVALQGMEERLLTRFKWGLLAELEKPNRELRHEILLSKIRHDGLEIPTNVVEYIADNVNESVRDLEGIVHSLLAFSVVYNRPIDLAMAKQTIKQVVRVEKKPVTLEHIIQGTCEYTNIKEEDIHSKSRKANIAEARQIAMFLAHRHTTMTASRIGMMIGKRNHATVLHAVKLIQERMKIDSAMQKKIEEIEKIIRKHLAEAE